MGNRIVWSDEEGDLRKKKSPKKDEAVDETELCLEIRRVTSGKGRTIIEVKGLPHNKKWCQKLAKDIKKKLATGGAYKTDFIEIHGEMLERVGQVLSEKSLKWKKTGG